MPVYPTHEHDFVLTSDSTERCMSCGYHRYRGVVGSEVVEPAESDGGQ